MHLLYLKITISKTRSFGYLYVLAFCLVHESHGNQIRNLPYMKWLYIYKS